MGLGDLAGKAQDAMNSEQGQKVAGEGLDRAADAANNATGDKYSDQVDQGKDAVSDHLGLGDNDEKGGNKDQQR
ncbi:MAG TPA: antitoxin [Brevibacterium senegalense]|uniref:Antitoxin n=1 Tax=Brevibacterium senegalense TaxID=1033736 RepID=A0A921SNY7_9MICO|nr:antitoxin [Brevibacterium senegalense]